MPDENQPAPADKPNDQPVEKTPAPEPEKTPAPAPTPAQAKVNEPEGSSMSDKKPGAVGGIYPYFEDAGPVSDPADTRNAENVYAAGDVIAYVAALGTAPPVGFAALSASTWGCLGWLDTAGGIFNLNHTVKDIGAAGTLSSIRTIYTGGNKTLQVTCLEGLNPLVRALYDDVPLSSLAPTVLRTDTATVTNASATVTDSSILSTDVGSVVTGTNIPANTYIVSVTPATSFVMSAAATGSGTSVTISTDVSVYIIPEVPQDNRYALILDSVDGENQIRMFCPMAKVTDRGNDQIQQGDAEMLQMTFTLFPMNITYNSATQRGSVLRYINAGALSEAFSEAPQVSVNP
jgi:hypothetical protein